MKRINVSDMIYDTIKADFVNDVIDFGEKFVEIEYATKLDVSRTPLREAIKKFEHEGIIVRQPNGRLRFIDITKDNVVEMFNIRIALENLLIELSMSNNIAIQDLQKNIDSAKIALEQNDIKTARKKTTEFTKILYNNITFEYTLKMLNQNGIILSKLKKRTLSPDSRVLAATKQHIELFNAIKNNDIQKAHEINKLHLIEARDIILSQM
ncbi:MAG: GntR family transcriptional regulator [Lachnospirales bacterium]